MVGYEQCQKAGQLLTKGKAMDEMNAPKEVRTDTWTLLLGVAAAQVLSYAEVTAVRVSIDSVELDTEDKEALEKNTESIYQIMAEGSELIARKSSPLTDGYGFRVLALLLDNLEINKMVNEKYWQKCDCEGCTLANEDYHLGKKMITKLAGLEITEA